MARLRHLASGSEHPLSARHLIGRAPTCALCIDDPAVSGYHAELTWNGEAWTVQDLGSRNGTAIDGRALPRGEHATLSVDGELVLAEKVRFALVDASPPTLIAIGPQGELREAAHELLCLPSDELPELTLFRELDGRWWVETDSDTRALGEAEHLVAGGVSWRVHAPISVAATREAGAAGLLSGQTLRFVVSRDGEHVELTLEHGGGTMPIRYRSHHTLLVELARRRALDIEQGQLPESECGWIYQDEILRDLKIEVGRMNLWIHRARQQLLSLGVRDGESLVERRPGSSQLRLGVSRVRISG